MRRTHFCVAALQRLYITPSMYCRAKDHHGRRRWSRRSQVESDGAALRWALGCIFASYSERITAMDIFQSVPARLILALLIVFMALSEFMAPMMALAYHEHDIVLLNFLGARTPGDDYHRFIPSS